MTIQTIKFSEMTDGGDLANNEHTPGLLAGGNVLFNNPWTFLPPGTTAERPAPSSLINYRLRFNTEDQLYEYYDAVLGQWTQLQESAFTQGPFITYTASASLPDAQNLGLLADGILKQTITAGVATVDIAVNGVDYYGPGFTGYFQSPAGTKDSNGNIILEWVGVSSAVNYMRFTNSITGVGPTLSSLGSDTNVGMNFNTQGTGPYSFSSLSSTPLFFRSGTAYQHVMTFTFPNTANSWDATWQDSSGTVAWLSDVAGTVTSAEGTENQVLVNGNFGTQETGACIFTTPQDIGLTSDVVFNSLQLATGTIFDANGNVILQMNLNPNAVNYFAIDNQPTGNPVEIGALGADTDIGLLYRAKAAGQHLFLSTSTSPIVFESGTANQHTTAFSFANTSASRTVTFQDADGTVAFTSDLPSLGDFVFTGDVMSNATTNANMYLVPNGTGNTIIGQALAPTSGFQLQVVAAPGGSGHSSVASYNNNTNFANFDALKSASATIGSHTAIASNEPIGAFNGWGDDGTNFVRAAQILFLANGTVSTGIVPGQIQFLTANTSGTRTLAMTIDSSQVLTLAHSLLPASGGLGTGTAPSAGQIPIGNSGGTYTPAAINSGTNITVANGSASITVNLSGIISPVLGGTGVSNLVGSTITLGGPLTLAGAFPAVFNITASTNVTFPTSGTLATTAGTVSSVSGTANRITSTGGTTPVIDISASYIGQSSITTLGTIGTGVWQGTLVSPIYGGTGVNNGSNTLTLAGTLATIGAFASTFTMTGATNVTFPTSGTLLTSAGAVTSITGTANQVIASASTGPVTLSLPQSIATTSTPTFGAMTLSGTGGLIALQLITASNNIVALKGTTNGTDKAAMVFGADAAGTGGVGTYLTFYNYQSGNFGFFNGNASTQVLNLTSSLATFSGALVAPSINFGGSTLANYVTSGTFTPVFTFTTPGDISVAYSVQSGLYTRVGNVVTCSIQIVCTPTFTTAAGQVSITGLPIATLSTATYELSSSFIPFGFAYPATATQLFLYAGPSATTMSMYGATPTGTNPQVGVTQFTTGVAIQIHASFSYLV